MKKAPLKTTKSAVTTTTMLAITPRGVPARIALSVGRSVLPEPAEDVKGSKAVVLLVVVAELDDELELPRQVWSSLSVT